MIPRMIPEQEKGKEPTKKLARTRNWPMFLEHALEGGDMIAECRRDERHVVIIALKHASLVLPLDPARKASKETSATS
jgi:hypothetical protein